MTPFSAPFSFFSAKAPSSVEGRYQRPSHSTPLFYSKSSRALGARGFSLIEIMIVLGIIGAIVALMSSRIGRTGDRELRRDVRYFAASIKDLRNKARMRNRTYRLVINLPDNPREKQAYWVESTSQKFLVTYDEDALKKLEEEKRDRKEGEPEPGGFEVDREVSGNEPKTLPNGLYFSGIEMAAQQKEFTAGRIYIHFFPEGRVEEAALHITNRDKLHWTLAIHPITGRVDIIAKETKLKDLSN